MVRNRSFIYYDSLKLPPWGIEGAFSSLHKTKKPLQNETAFFINKYLF
jgi:hypothetical protein